MSETDHTSIDIGMVSNIRNLAVLYSLWSIGKGSILRLWNTQRSWKEHK